MLGSNTFTLGPRSGGRSWADAAAGRAMRPRTRTTTRRRTLMGVPSFRAGQPAGAGRRQRQLVRQPARALAGKVLDGARDLGLVGERVRRPAGTHVPRPGGLGLR